MVHLVCRSGCSSNAAFFGVPLGPLYSGRQRVPARRMRSRTRGLRRRRRKDERFVLPPAMVIRAEPRGGIARGDPAARPPRNASVAASGICYRVLVSPVAPPRASVIVSMPPCGEKPNERIEMRRRARGTPAVAPTPSPGRDSVQRWRAVGFQLYSRNVPGAGWTQANWCGLVQGSVRRAACRPKPTVWPSNPRPPAAPSRGKQRQDAVEGPIAVVETARSTLLAHATPPSFGKERKKKQARLVSRESKAYARKAYARARRNAAWVVASRRRARITPPQPEHAS